MQETVKVGDWVRHAEFGDGLVLETKGKGDDASVVVSFPDNTRRRLMLRFAGLTRLDPSEGHAAKLATPEPGTPRKAKPRASKKASQ